MSPHNGQEMRGEKEFQKEFDACCKHSGLWIMGIQFISLNLNIFVYIAVTYDTTICLYIFFHDAFIKCTKWYLVYGLRCVSTFANKIMIILINRSINNHGTKYITIRIFLTNLGEYCKYVMVCSTEKCLNYMERQGKSSSHHNVNCKETKQVFIVSSLLHFNAASKHAIISNIFETSSQLMKSA